MHQGEVVWIKPSFRLECEWSLYDGHQPDFLSRTALLSSDTAEEEFHWLGMECEWYGKHHRTEHLTHQRSCFPSNIAIRIPRVLSIRLRIGLAWDGMGVSLLTEKLLLDMYVLRSWIGLDWIRWMYGFISLSHSIANGGESGMKMHMKVKMENENEVKKGRG